MFERVEGTYRFLKTPDDALDKNENNEIKTLYKKYAKHHEYYQLQVLENGFNW